jgi:hypothetical protein
MFSNEDLIKYRQFKAVLNKGKFEIYGEATVIVASLFSWFNELENKMKASIPPKVMTISPPISPIEEKKTIRPKKV